MPKTHMLDHYDLFYRYLAHAACGRLLPLNQCYTAWSAVNCKKCRRLRVRPDQTEPPPQQPLTEP